MSFLTYKSIPNHNNKKEINYFFTHNPEYLSKKFICQHKYDGSNFQVIFTKQFNTDGSFDKIKISFASRNCLLDDSSDFNNFKSILKEQVHQKSIENIQFFMQESQVTQINLFGEIYGKVQKRIKYDSDDKNKILYFDVVFDGVYQNTKFFLDWAKQLEIPVVETFMIGTFDECLAFDLNQIKTSAGDKIEGVVIKPYDDDDSKSFYVKLKTEGFEEIQVKKTEKEPKQKMEKTKFHEEFPELEKFGGYVNANRAISAFSKKPWAKKEMSQLANEILLDAFKDYKVDIEDSKLTIEIVKKVFLNDVFKIITEQKFFN